MPTHTKFIADLKALNLEFEGSELSKNLQYAESTISEYISGKKNPSRRFLEKFYKHYYPDKANQWDSEEHKITVAAEAETPLRKNMELTKHEIEELLSSIKKQADSIEKLATTMLNQSELMRSQHETIKEFINRKVNTGQLASSM